MEITLYQTLEDRENPDQIENEGPFICRDSEAWLGQGYYFWDTHIELGHWWGIRAYGIESYVICRAYGIIDSSCWDLIGIGQHRLEFEQACKLLIDEGISTKDDLIVPNVIEFLKRKKMFPYKAIRTLSMDTIQPNQTEEWLVLKIKFNKRRKSYLDLHPAIQLCLFEKRGLSLKDYVIVFPDNYVESAYA
ncbi:MAG: hypothetical protein ACJLTB_12550 [Algoriphagus aquaeductus]|jgi:hypothetical protein|uniref:hypothetical protein n=1 Tax=Algoriphagus aquaeductus TaxID=475299 RepID=UPI003879BB28